MQSVLAEFHVNREASSRVHQQIEAYLETSIRDGRLAPGARFPTTPGLARLWHVNLVAVHRAMTSLRDKGLVDRKARLGTRVREVMERKRIGIMVGPDLSLDASHYYRALTARLQEAITARGWDQGLQQGLVARVKEARASAGVRVGDVVGGGGTEYDGLVLIGMLPKIADALTQALDVPTVRCIQTVQFADLLNDMYHFAYDAVSYLVKRGCQRLAFLGSFPGSQTMQGVQDAILELDVAEPEFHGVLPTGSCPREVQVADTVKSMVADWQQGAAMPDAIVVADDVAMDAAVRVLADSGHPGLDRLLLLCSANEDILLDYALPVIRYEFPVAAKAEKALEILAMRLRDREPQRLPVCLRGKIVEPR